jgi:hypothetical protein
MKSKLNIYILHVELNVVVVLTCMYCYLPMIVPLTRIRSSSSS